MPDASFLRGSGPSAFFEAHPSDIRWHHSCLASRNGRRPAIQMADKPPSTDNSTPFTKLESSEARNSATVAISSG